MAKVLYNNKFILTKKLHKQYCQETFKATRKRTKTICLIFSPICLIAGFLILIFLHMTIPTCVAFMAAIYFLLMAFWGYTFSEWINFRSMEREYGRDVVTIMDFMPVQIFVKVGSSSFSFKYETIQKVYETEDIFILILKTKGMIEHGQIVFKNGFGEGVDIQEFKRFLNDKSGKELFVTE